MSYTVLARRYRSTTFDEVVGQVHVAQTLKKAIASGRVAHAYLFCGTRGVGKTSMARILGKALNCEKSDAPTTEPCGTCASCQAIARGDDIDVIEIDAASNTGVDNIREVIENSQYRPARSHFKVYIIDEVHMLSKSAFNALLKTLEEPPSHVKFILATTEPEKVLATILSRCQRYDFRNIPTREIADHLQAICTKEKIKADEDALLLVAKAGAGSMRDSLSLLDRLLSIGEKHLTGEMIEQLLGLPKTQLVFDLAQAIGEGDTKTVLSQADSMIQSGLSPDTLLASLIDHLRNLLILRTCGTDSNLVEVPGLSLNDLSKQAQRFDPIAITQDITILEELRRQIRQSQGGRALLDATLVRLALADQFSSVADLLARVGGGNGAGSPPAQKKKPEPLSSPAVPEVTTPYRNAAAPAAPAPAAQQAAPAPAASVTSATDDEDDDLPRPGKVWDSGGPSLSELLKQRTAGAAPADTATSASPAAAAPTEASNVELVGSTDLPTIWGQLLQLAAQHGPGLPALLSAGRLSSIGDEWAVIRYAAAHSSISKLLERNGKKEQLRDVLSKVLNRSIGVKIEIDEEEPEAAVTAQPAASEPATRPSDAGERISRPRTGSDIAPPPPPPPPAPTIALTPELKRTLENEPMIRTVLETLGGNIVKVE